MSSTYIVAIDLECGGGCTPKHGFTQLGAVLMRMEDSAVLASFNEYSNMQGFEWEERCVEEFWKKNPERYQETLAGIAFSQSTPAQVVDHFYAWLDEHTKDKKDATYIISDNAAFDLGILKCFSTQRDTMYSFGKYRSMVDVSDVYNGLSLRPVTIDLLNGSSKEQALEGLNKLRLSYGLGPLQLPEFTHVSHTHQPVDDATVMGLYFCFFQREMRTLNM